MSPPSSGLRLHAGFLLCLLFDPNLHLNGYPQGFNDSVINSKDSSRLNEEQKPLGSVYIPYVKGVSEKFKRIGN
jgi:hypothetical protein